MSLGIGNMVEGAHAYLSEDDSGNGCVVINPAVLSLPEEKKKQLVAAWQWALGNLVGDDDQQNGGAA